MYKLCFYVPISHVDQVKDALFKAGAGKMGDYSHCAWQVLGEGQFKPLQGSDPAIGEINELTKVKEYKVEMVINTDKIKEILTTLKKAHPYETPAFEVSKLEVF